MRFEGLPIAASDSLPPAKTAPASPPARTFDSDIVSITGSIAAFATGFGGRWRPSSHSVPSALHTGIAAAIATAA